MSNTFNQWLKHKTKDTTLKDIVMEFDIGFDGESEYGYDYLSETSLMSLLEEAYVSGYNSCRDDWGGLEYSDPFNEKTEK